MRSVFKRMTAAVALTAAAMIVSGSARANVQITVDKNTQTMVVAVDGETRYKWPVSTGTPAHETPAGAFKTFRMEADHYSKEWDDAPMPHSIFFTARGHAIHGTDSLSRLGSPASHGCVRLSRANAATLFALVQRQGVTNTTVTLSGSSQVALARAAKPRGEPTLARATAPVVNEPVSLAPQDPMQTLFGARVSESDGNLDRTPVQPPAYRNVYGAQRKTRSADDDWQMQQTQRGYGAQRGADGRYYVQRDIRPAYPSPRDYSGYSD